MVQGAWEKEGSSPCCQRCWDVRWGAEGPSMQSWSQGLGTGPLVLLLCPPGLAAQGPRERWRGRASEGAWARAPGDPAAAPAALLPPSRHAPLAAQPGSRGTRWPPPLPVPYPRGSTGLPRAAPSAGAQGAGAGAAGTRVTERVRRSRCRSASSGLARGEGRWQVPCSRADAGLGWRQGDGAIAGRTGAGRGDGVTPAGVATPHIMHRDRLPRRERREPGGEISAL